METKARTMKVFSMNDCDWMAGESLEECKADYLARFHGGNLGEAEEAFDGPAEVSAEAMDRMIFRDEDGTTRTFRQQLDKEIAEGQKFPCFFASTEY